MLDLLSSGTMLQQRGGNVRRFVNNLSALDGDLMIYDYFSNCLRARAVRHIEEGEALNGRGVPDAPC